MDELSDSDIAGTASSTPSLDVGSAAACTIVSFRDMTVCCVEFHSLLSWVVECHPLAERRLFELWHYGTKRCRMTPREGQRPFMVTVHDGEKLAVERAFEDHDSACAYAVEQLRLATTVSNPSGS